MGNQVVFSFTLTGLLVVILCIVAIVALVALIMVLFKLAKALGAVSEVLDQNKQELDSTLKNLPGITASLNSSMTEVNHLLVTSGPEISETLSEVRKTMTNVSKLSADATDTVEYVASSAIDTVESVTNGLATSASSLSYVREIVDVLRSIIKK